MLALTHCIWDFLTHFYLIFFYISVFTQSLELQITKADDQKSSVKAHQHGGYDIKRKRLTSQVKTCTRVCVFVLSTCAYAYCVYQLKNSCIIHEENTKDFGF